MGAAIRGEESEVRAREMAALAPQQRNMMIAMGILSGTVIDGRQRFAERPIAINLCELAHSVDYDDWWPSPPTGAA